MCGIVGLFGNITTPHETLFKQLLTVDQLRGAHSTGAVSVKRHNKEIAIAKALGGPENLLDTKSFDKVLAQTHRVLLGHNRFATQGAISTRNAHPFEFDKVVGVHNGSLTGYNNLDGYGDFPVDSQVLYNHINNHGLKDAVDNCWGAMALVWWNKDSQELNIYRNEQRPLFYGTTKDGMTVIGSEFGMLDWICDRSNVTLESLEQIPQDMHFRFHLEEGKMHSAKPIAEKVVRKTYASFPKSTVSQNGNSNALVVSNVTPIHKHPSNLQLADAKVLARKQDVYEVLDKMTIGSMEGHLCSNMMDENPFFLVATPLTADVRKGDMVQTDVSGHFIVANKLYYTLRIKDMLHYDATVVEMPTTTRPEDDMEDVQGDRPFHTPSGRAITQGEWYKHYGTCAHCSGDNEYATCVSLPISDAVICGECASDPVVRDALTS